jgi:hypothetical protein
MGIGWPADKPERTSGFPVILRAARVQRMGSRKRKGANPTSSTKEPIPHRIADEDFEGLVTPVGSKSLPLEIPLDQAESTKKRLDKIVDLIAADMRNPAPKRKAVRLAIQSAARALRRARKSLRNIPNEDHAIAAFNTLTIATMVNDQWLRDFSGGVFQPAAGRNRTPFGENAELVRRETYVEGAQCGFKIATELVGQIETALAPSLKWITAVNRRGGRDPFEYKKFLMTNLAEIWEGLGRKLKTGSGSDFTAFCENIFECVGWESDGLIYLVNQELSRRRASKG